MTAHTWVTADGSHVVLPWHAGLAGAVPHARTLVWRGDTMLVLPNQPEETRVARNLGLDVPAPILTRYDWAGSKPWDIQKITAALLTESVRCYVLSSMGTGKTRAVLYAADYLMRQDLAKRMLIVAPLSTMTPVWEREIFNLMLKYSVRILYGSKERRLKLLEENTPICVINHHGLKVLGDHVLSAGFDVVVFDELAIYRNKQTDLWAFANQLVCQTTTRYVWGLTGSPTPNAPTDAWAQVRLLTPWQTTRAFTQFRDQTMVRLSQFRYIPRPYANQIVQAAMSPSVRYTLDDVMELPDTSYVDRHVPLDPAAAQAYRLLYTKARMLSIGGDPISAVNAGVLQNKLLQVSCGFIYTDKGTVYALPAKGRLATLEEILAETDRKVLVLVPFLHALHGVATHLRSAGHKLEVVHGATTRAQRDRIFSDFQYQPEPRIIVAHPQTLAHGLTLVEANTIVWYSPTTSSEVYAQANARINRPGQKHKTLIVHMAGTPAERATYTALRTKQRMQDCLLELFAAQEKAF
jgi:SNF2 family DNA or RNA helicase